MHIHAHIRERIQNLFAQGCIEFHGIHRIILSGTTCLYLKGHVLIRVDLIHIGNNLFCQFIKALVLDHDSRTDACDTKNMAECFYGLLIIIVTFGFHKHTSLLLVHMKSAIHTAQSITDLAHQCILKKMAVLALDTDLCIFDQKCLIHNFLLFNFFCILPALEPVLP